MIGTPVAARRLWPFAATAGFIAVPMGSVQRRDERFNFVIADVKPLSPAHIEAAVEQVRDTLHDMADQKVMQVFVHPRPGLMTPYLSDDWFRLWKAALDEAERLDMNIWIYDENSYPSGFAGGWVPELMPESRGRGGTTVTWFLRSACWPSPAATPSTCSSRRVNVLSTSGCW